MREWALRLSHELQYWEDASFITLTYEDEFLPEDLGLRITDLQLFFKRLRKLMDKGSKRKVKYFAAGEYGDINKRPHYHIIMFGIRNNEVNRKMISNVWRMGFVHMGNVNDMSMRYVTSYVFKKYNGKKALEVHGERQAQFQLVSKGIGERWINDNSTEIIDNCGFKIEGIVRSIPRYYQKKVGEWFDNETVEMRRIQRAFERQVNVYKVCGNETQESLHIIQLRNQKEEELKTKEGMRKLRKF